MMLKGCRPLCREPVVDDAAMFADNNIVESAVIPADHTMLVAAIQAAGLVETLSRDGPFTGFVSTNAAFAAYLMAQMMIC